MKNPRLPTNGRFSSNALGCRVAKLLAGVVMASTFTLGASEQYALDWFTIDGGGGASTGGVYAASGAIGQPDAGMPMTGGPYSLTGGFWALPQAVRVEGTPALSIRPATSGYATISWTPDTGINWVLQETLNVTVPAWTDSPSGTNNPALVPATLPTKFYRLFKP